MSIEISGSGKEASATLNAKYADLSTEIHPAAEVRAPSVTISLAQERFGAAESKKFATELRDVLKSALIIIAAVNRPALSKLDATNRE